MIALEPLGDRAFFARFPDEDSAARWAASVRVRAIEGVTDVVAAYRSAAVYVDPTRIDPGRIETRLRELDTGVDPGADLFSGRLVTIPVLYNGLDLQFVADSRKLTTTEVIVIHSEPEYRVFAIGFLPGFPYAGYLPEALSGLARRSEPRVRVPAGSVAIVGRQTGIYPMESPGGWHLLGQTPLRIADPDQGAFPIRAGDRVRFVSIDAEEFEARLNERL